MNPGGETEQILNGFLQLKSVKPDLFPESQNKGNKKNGVQLAAAPAAALALPWLATEVPGWVAGAAGLLGMTLPLKGDMSKDDNCDYQLYNVDTPTCNEIAKRRGKQAGARCRATASERYSACLAGKRRDQWPPLDTWNN